METEVAGNATDNLGAPEPSNLAGVGRDDILDSGQVGRPDVECKENTFLEEGVHDPSEIEAVGLGTTRNTAFEVGEEKKEKGGTLVQCTAESMEATLEVEQMPSGGISNNVQDIMIDTETKDAEIEAKSESQAEVMPGEKATDSLTMDVAKDAGTYVSSPLEEGVGSGEMQSVQADPPADVSKRLDTKVICTVNTSPNRSSEFTNVEDAEESLLESRALAKKAETTRNFDGTMNNLESLVVIQESRKEADRHRIASSGIAEVLAAGVAAGVAEGIAESIAETIAKETAGLHGQGSLEGRVFDSGRFERLAIAKAVAEVIAESVAQEVAQGLADGLAEAAATAGASNGVEEMKPDNIQGGAEANEDGVLCDCGLVAIVRVVGDKSPNRGLRYLMCSLQEPSFFKRKGKRKDSDTVGKCKFFRWLDTPRHPSKDDKKSQEKVKAQVEDPNTSHLTRSFAKKENLESPTTAGTSPPGDAGEVSPSEFPSSRNTDDGLQSPEVPEFMPDLKSKSARKQRKKGLADESGRDDVLVADRPTSAGTLTRSALRKGAPEPAQEPSLDTSAVSTPASALGKRTIDWTDNYVGPESQVFEKGATWRKRRSVRGESGPSSRYSSGGSGSGRNAGFVSSEKKPLHYFRRSTGHIGASDGESIPLISVPNTATDVESAGVGHKDEGDNHFKSYYKKGKLGSSLEPKSAEDISPVETERRTKSQTRRQQRKLPLSEVYGTMDPLLPAKATKKGTTILAAKDDSLSPSGQSFGKSAPSDVASDPKEAGLSKSPSKKRKLSWVLSEDSVVREMDSPKRTFARKSISSAHTDYGSHVLSSSVIETPLVASVFPTVRYEAKLPVEDYHDPDDPWSLEIPWAKQEHQAEEAQQLEREKETCEDQNNEEGESMVVKMDVVTRIEALNETSATIDELPKTVLNATQSLSVPGPVEHVGFETFGDIIDPEASNMDPKEAGGQGCVISGSHVDLKTIHAIEDTCTPLVDAVDGGENTTLACASQAGRVHPEPLHDGHETGNVLKEDVVETQHEVLPDGQTVGDETQTSMLAAQTGAPIEADEHELLMSETAIVEVPGSIDESDQSAPDKIDSTAPLEQLPFTERAEILANGCTQSVHDEEPVAEEVVNCEDNILIGSVSTVSKDSSSKFDDTVETGIILPCEKSEPSGTLGDAEATTEREIMLSGDEQGIDGIQDVVKGADGPIEEPAGSGSNLIGNGRPDARVDEGSDHEPERDLRHTHLDQDAAFKSPRETDHAGAAAASENAGFVNSVWRLASGKKTRSIGSIGAPAVTSKRLRSVVPSQKGGPKVDPKQQAEIKWVDVPLDWRNEKSTGRVPLLPNLSGKGLNGSDTSQSDLRLLQSGDTSQGTHSARPRLARGEVDDSSIITEEKEKGHDAFNEDCMGLFSQITKEAAHGGQATLGSMEMDDEASVPAGEQYLGDPTNQHAIYAGGDNGVQKRKRGRPRKDSKKHFGLQYPEAGGHNLGAAVGGNETPEPELVGVVGKADGEPSSMLICSTAMEANTLTELHGEDRVSQLERSASNSERENERPEGVFSGPEECERPLDGNGFPGASTEGLHSETGAPYCSCKVSPRPAILKTVTRSGDPNEGLRYWSCSNNRKPFSKKRKSSSEVTEESCKYLRWLDTPRFTAKDIREARKERYRQVELQRLL